MMKGQTSSLPPIISFMLGLTEMFHTSSLFMEISCGTIDEVFSYDGLLMWNSLSLS